MLEGRGVPGGGEQRGKNWENCNSTINKIYLRKQQPRIDLENGDQPYEMNHKPCQSGSVGWSIMLYNKRL